MPRLAAQEAVHDAATEEHRHHSEGFDLARWHTVEFHNAAGTAEYDHRVAALGLRQERRS